METGLIHIISEIGGCIIGDPPDKDGISKSLLTYANRHDMADLKLLDPPTDNLGAWAGMAAFAIEEYGIEGPVLVGTCRGDRVLLGVSKRYGLPAPESTLDDIFEVVAYPG